MNPEIKSLITSVRAKAAGNDAVGLRPDADTALLADEVERLDAILNTPEFFDFIKAVPLEAAHQVQRWGTEQDAGKTPWDWFWLIGYLSQKAAAAATAGDQKKALHHTISTAAALANWHAQLLGKSTMRPGIDPAAEQGPTTFDRTKAILVNEFGVPGDNITPSAGLTEHLGLDSLDEVEFIMALEEEFDIKMSDADSLPITLGATVQDVVTLIDRLTK